MMLSTALIGSFVRFLNLYIEEKPPIWPRTLTIFIFDKKLEIRQSAAVPESHSNCSFSRNVNYRFNRWICQIIEL
jgi:hypothetical protein